MSGFVICIYDHTNIFYFNAIEFYCFVYIGPVFLYFFLQQRFMLMYDYQKTTVDIYLLTTNFIFV